MHIYSDDILFYRKEALNDDNGKDNNKTAKTVGCIFILLILLGAIAVAIVIPLVILKGEYPLHLILLGAIAKVPLPLIICKTKFCNGHNIK